MRTSTASRLAQRGTRQRPGKEFVGVQRELYLGEDDPSTMSTYERLLGDAMVGDGALFTDEEAVMAAWAVVEPVLARHGAALPYEPGSWGPAAAAAPIVGDGGWQDPLPSPSLTPLRCPP